MAHSSMAGDEIREGRCVGGPWDGKLLAHWNSRLPLVKPMMELALNKPFEELTVEQVTMGWYVWYNGAWIWSNDGY